MVKYTPDGMGDGRLTVNAENSPNNSQSISSNIWSSRTRMKKILLILLVIFIVVLTCISVILAKDKDPLSPNDNIQQNLPIQAEIKAGKFCKIIVSFIKILTGAIC